MPREVQDPYAPPPPRKDKSGRWVRYALVAAMLGAGAWGYAEFSKGDQTATLTQPAAEEQRVADASNTVTPEAIPSAAPNAATPAPPTTPTPSRPSPAPAEPVPPPAD